MTIAPDTPRHRYPVWGETLGVAALLVLLGVLAWPGLSAPLLLDDLDQLAYVRGFRGWHDCFGNDCYGLFRPAKNLIFYACANRPLITWHALNLAIYLAAVVAVFLCLRRLLDSAIWALVAVALWATSPTQASTVVWVSCANISLAVALACGCLFCHDLAQVKAGRTLGLSVLACLALFLAQCSYEAAVAVPALCVLVDALRQRPLFSRAAVLRYATLAAVTLSYLALRAHLGAAFSASHTNPGFAPDTRNWQLSLSAPWFLWRHFSMWVQPAGRLEICGSYLWGLSATPWELAASWAWLILLGGVIMVTRKRQVWIAFGLLWFLIASFPSSNFIPIWAGPITDCYLVMPGIGLAIALAGCARSLLGWVRGGHLNPESQLPLIGGALLGFIALWRVLCIPLFWLQAGLWTRPLELFLHCEATRPGQYQAQALAARELLAGGQLAEAKEWAQKAYATGPWHGTSSMVLASIALAAGDSSEADRRFREILRIAPANTATSDWARFRLAQSLLAQKTDLPLVRETLLPLLNNPHSSAHLEAINLQIDCYLAQGKPTAAHHAAAKAVQLHPDNRQLGARLKGLVEQFPTTAAPEPPPK